MSRLFFVFCKVWQSWSNFTPIGSHLKTSVFFIGLIDDNHRSNVKPWTKKIICRIVLVTSKTTTTRPFEIQLWLRNLVTEFWPSTIRSVYPISELLFLHGFKITLSLNKTHGSPVSCFKYEASTPYIICSKSYKSFRIAQTNLSRWQECNYSKHALKTLLNRVGHILNSA